MANEINKLIQKATDNLAEMKQLNLNELSTQVNSLKGTKTTSKLEEVLQQLQTIFNGFEFDICEDEDKRESLDLNDEQVEEFNNIIEERTEILSRLKVII